jgi:hypothetical protein
MYTWFLCMYQVDRGYPARTAMQDVCSRVERSCARAKINTNYATPTLCEV